MDDQRPAPIPGHVARSTVGCTGISLASGEKDEIDEHGWPYSLVTSASRWSFWTSGRLPRHHVVTTLESTKQRPSEGSKLFSPEEPLE